MSRLKCLLYAHPKAEHFYLHFSLHGGQLSAQEIISITAYVITMEVQMAPVTLLVENHVNETGS
jgi:hypothetical protein